MSNFIHLHTHSEYSLLDGAARIDGLVKKAVSCGMSALALTDHGVMYGMIDFYDSAKKAGIKPIIGCEFYVATRSRFERGRQVSTYDRMEDSPYHLVLLARNETGRKTLMKLVTLSFFEGYYYKPRIDLELLEKYNEGVIGLSACIAGEVPRNLLLDRYDKAKEAARRYEEFFGEGNFYLELQDQGLEEQKKANEGLIKLSRETGLPLVATNDIHYLESSDKPSHDVILCVQTKSTMADEKRFEFESDQYYFKTEGEMSELFREVPEAVKNTLEVAGKCDLELKFEQVLPYYQIPKEYSQSSYLEKLCHDGLIEYYGGNIPAEARERLDFELQVIERMGFESYFLIVWDIVKFAKENGIRVGPGRGSAAGSLVSFALGITALDPLKHGLLFERFLNPERKTMPDIDLDFSEDRRDEVIEYVRQKYGEDHVAQIIAFSTLGAKAATKDAGRVLGYAFGQVDRLAKFITGDTIEQSIKENPELKDMYQKDEDARKILDTAKPLEGLVRQDTIHAAGIVISREELNNYVPLQRKGENRENEKVPVVTQLPKETIEKIGLLKIDILGLRNLTVIAHALRLIKERHGTDLDIDKLSLDDKKVYQLLSKGNTIGVFQMEKPGMQSILKELKPTTFEDIVAANALNRPGPIKSGMVKDFINRKHKRKTVNYMHPSLESVLKDTYGTIVYQEQVMGIASRLAGYSMAEADILRKAISKKEEEIIETQKHDFIERAVKNKVERDIASKIFDLVIPFAGYAFNKSHSAAYAVLAYQTAYLKTYYPTEFIAALLTSVWKDQDKTALFVNDARRIGIKVLPPDINRSQKGYSIEDDRVIRFGFTAVRNVGENIIEQVLKARTSDFISIFDFCERVDLSVVNKRTVESLIKAGCFDSTGITRNYCLEIYELAIERGSKRQKEREKGQFSLFEGFEEASAGADDYPIRLKEMEEQKEFSKNELLSMEKEMLGVFVSDNPLLSIEKELKSNSVSSAELPEKKEGETVTAGGIITNIIYKVTKKGETMASLTLEDLEGQVNVIVFSTTLKKFEEKVKEDNIVFIKGRIDRDTLGNGETKLIALEVKSFEEIERKAANPKTNEKNLHIKIDSVFFNDILKEELKRVLSDSEGPSEVFVHLKAGDSTRTLRLGERFKVAINSSLLAELKSMLGEKAIEVS